MTGRLEVTEISCRPVDWSLMRERLGFDPGYDATRIYTGSVKFPCFHCETDVWVGPRQQEEMTKPGRMYVIRCFPCSILLHAATGAMPPIICLDNPEGNPADGQGKRD